MTMRGLVIQGAVHVIGDDINTDYIIASRYKGRFDDLSGLTAHLFEDYDPGLAARIAVGDILVAGENFGSGSSRETAPRVIQSAGVAAVVAKSFARIFFRNAINVGLPVIEAAWTAIAPGDSIEIDTRVGQITGRGGDVVGTFEPLPDFLTEILEAGGVRGLLKRGG
jgi:3-isopropylmalate/(R)-2-methylmalate dehydratase small subunit